MYNVCVDNTGSVDNSNTVDNTNTVDNSLDIVRDTSIADSAISYPQEDSVDLDSTVMYDLEDHNPDRVVTDLTRRSHRIRRDPKWMRSGDYVS